MEEIKGERNEFQSDGTENHHQHGLDLGGFEVKLIRLLIENTLWLCAEFCPLLERGAHFQKHHKTIVEKRKMMPIKFIWQV